MHSLDHGKIIFGYKNHSKLKTICLNAPIFKGPIHPEGFNGLSVPGDSFTFSVVQTFRNSPYWLRYPMILLRYSLVMETFHSLKGLNKPVISGIKYNFSELSNDTFSTESPTSTSKDFWSYSLSFCNVRFPGNAWFENSHFTIEKSLIFVC